MVSTQLNAFRDHVSISVPKCCPTHLINTYDYGGNASLQLTSISEPGLARLQQHKLVTQNIKTRVQKPIHIE